MRNRYPSDLTDEEWAVLQPMADPKGGRPGPNPRKYERRRIVDALMYLARTGCPWRSLPKDFPKWEAVYFYFRTWRDWGVFGKMNAAMVEIMRKRLGRDHPPTVALVDSQTVKTTEEAVESTRGYDGGKKIKGRKRHVLTDALGLLLCAIVTVASVQDRDGGAALLDQAAQQHPTVSKTLADSAYNGSPVAEAMRRTGIDLEVVRRPKGSKGFVVQALRWKVERFFGWLNRWRRLSKDYERLPRSSVAMVQIACIGRMARWLGRNA